ncbi:hypothetical protein LNQ03_19765 [Klebsiella pneumoniae subsp. pneumoniae]|nr:hypothetical protein [Klebsiella pneumoniae subsp. pneumoniae]
MDKGFNAGKYAQRCADLALGCGRRFRLAAEELAAAVCRSDSFTPGPGQSKNVVMVRAMRAMGVDYAAEYSAALWLPGAEHCPHGIVGAGLSLLYAPAGRLAVIR